MPTIWCRKPCARRGDTRARLQRRSILLPYRAPFTSQKRSDAQRAQPVNNAPTAGLLSLHGGLVILLVHGKRAVRERAMFEDGKLDVYRHGLWRAVQPLVEQPEVGNFGRRERHRQVITAHLV